MRVKECVKFFGVVMVCSFIAYLLMSVLLDKEFRQPKRADTFTSRLKYSNKNLFGKDLLEDIGFVRNPRLYPQSYHDEAEDLPVFIGAVSSDTFEDFMEMIYTQRVHFPDKKLVVFNLDLSVDKVQIMRENCRCVVRDFTWKRFPAHVQQVKYKAYRPIIIQESLMEFGAVFWADEQTRFTSAEIYNLVGQAERVGLVAWSFAYPTTTFTHPSMFRYFNISSEHYQLHKMVQGDRLILYNTLETHNNLMLPWVKCALDIYCIAPMGAQFKGCDLTLTPKFTYAGCHKYDTSALNVVLGKAYNFDQPYIALFDIFDVVKPNKKKNKFGFL